MKKVYGFANFVSCVQLANSGKVEIKEMKLKDFFVWSDYSSAYKINHSKPRPYLKDIVEVVAGCVKYMLSYKTKFSSDSSTLELDFLKLKSAKGGFKTLSNI